MLTTPLENTVFRNEHTDLLRTPWDWCEIPEFDTLTHRYSLREDHILKYGFAVLNESAIEALLPFSPWLEVGAGSGYWSYELRRQGADVIATDPRPPDGVSGSKTNEFPLGPCWLEVEALQAVDALRKYPERNLLTVWPSYLGDWTHRMLPHFKGEYLAYVGEGEGGCTGSDRMHQYLASAFESVAEVSIPQFWGIHDSLAIYKRKPRKARTRKTHRSQALVQASGRHFRMEPQA